MNVIERYQTHKDVEFDLILYEISTGKIKSGRYSHLVKIDKTKECKSKELFKNGKSNKDSS